MSENIRFFVHGDYLPDENTLNILNQMAQAEGVVRPIVALPDLHFKFSYHTPTGTVVLTRDRIIPKFVNANCGMSFITTPFFIDDINESTIDSIFNHLKSNISVSTRVRPVISDDQLKDIVRNGAAWSVNKYQMDPADLFNFENQGSLLKDDARSIEEILKFVPQACRRMGLFSLGVLGYGNHFIELQVVDKVIDEDIARKFNVSCGQLVFMLHSDSRAFGQSIYDFYSQKAKRLMGLQRVYKNMHYKIFSSHAAPIIRSSLRSVNHCLNRVKSVLYWKMDKFSRKTEIKFESIEPGSKEEEAYLAGTYCALNYGYANRAYLASVIRDALAKACNKKITGMHILYDGNHDTLQKEVIDGEQFYVHRNGANRALPPRYFPNHPVFSQTGQPVLLPSALGQKSFLCAAASGCRESYYSSCHGTGRLIDRGQARRAFKAEEVFGEAKKKRLKIYDYGKGYVAEESPSAFKDVEKILETISKYNIAQPVARLKPLAVLKGWR